MSAETKKAVEDAIAAHIASADGGYLTEWVLLAASVNEELEDGQRWHFMLTGDGQPVYANIGIMRRGLLDYENDTLKAGNQDD